MQISTNVTENYADDRKQVKNYMGWGRLG